MPTTRVEVHLGRWRTGGLEAEVIEHRVLDLDWVVLCLGQEGRWCLGGELHAEGVVAIGLAVGAIAPANAAADDAPWVQEHRKVRATALIVSGINARVAADPEAVRHV
eukprot:SAG31_NODE_13490_length_865_cov_2.473029_1_plen_107_part_01